ncbi:MAG: hypothetical protein KC443_01420 [Anaerolineales bacterium]|nr:hypothetical protein [Anaerolineales bacterium]
MKTMQYKYSTSFLAFHGLATLVWSSLILFIGYGLLNAFIEEISLYSLDLFGLLSLLVIGGFTLIPPLAFLVVWLSSFPTIRTSKQGIQVSTFISNSRWLSWKDVEKFRRFSLANTDIWFVGIRGLGKFYVINGVVYRLGVSGFLIGKSFERRDEFLNQLKTECPNLFKQH